MRFLTRFVYCAAAILALSSCSEEEAPHKLKVACGSVGIELKLCSDAVKRWSEANNYPAEIVSMPASASERLALYQQFLSAKQSSIDVFQIDVVWPGILKTHLLDLKPFVPQEEVDQHFESIIKNNTVDGQLLALPLYTDVGILYYRKDLLEKYDRTPPKTWQELTVTAQYIQDAERAEGKPDMWGYVWQGKAYEGLTCNALEWVSSSGGGSLVQADGTITVANDEAAEAINRAASWIGTITPQGVLNYSEEESRGVFQSGKAVFMRNWPYAWSLAQGEGSPIKGKVGVAMIPNGGDPDDPHSGTLGGWEMGVSKYSKQQEKAVDLVRYLTGPETQYAYALEASYNPTIRDLYKDQRVLDALPASDVLYDALSRAVPRPSRATGLRYNRVSYDFWNAVHAVLSGDDSAKDELTAIKKRWQRFQTESGEWQ
ncbi:MAG: ABC transporter substrate-binding protein [Alphaproteobacteria bacterium]|nr:ABC transporter substrate-binding protein [Alphaproteobacteria bacterium]